MAALPVTTTADIRTEPLIFMLELGMKTPINGQNGVCFSNVVTIPGPDGWRVSGVWGGPGLARPLVEKYFSQFLQKCAVYGSPANSAPPTIFWNDKGQEGAPERQVDTWKRLKQVQVQIN